MMDGMTLQLSARVFFKGTEYTHTQVAIVMKDIGKMVEGKVMALTMP